MYVVYMYRPSSRRADGADTLVDDEGYWADIEMFKSECYWIVPGTVDPRDD